MRGPRLLLTNATVSVAAVVVGWALLDGGDEPAGPDLGPAVQVRLSSTTPAPSGPTPPATGALSTTSPPVAAATNRPTSTRTTGSTPPNRVTPPTRLTPSSGAQTVPRHSPMPAGDDDGDDDDDDHDDDDHDDDEDEGD